MYEYGDLFGLTSTTTPTDFLPYAPQISNSSPPPPPLLPSSSSSSSYHSHPSGFVHPSEIIVNNDFDSVLWGIKSEFDYSTSSSSYGSLPSCYAQRPSLVQRSLSSHSLLQRDSSSYHPLFSSLNESHPEILKLETTGPMRKVFSTGDLQGTNMMQQGCRSESPLSNDNCIIDGMNKATPYNAEERKERIERYRSKRNQRNFNKKIKYACRKTLADSRPRIRGRFARNDEVGDNSVGQWSQMGREENEEEDYLWLNYFDQFNLVP